MIVRILNEGQWRLDDALLSELNRLDNAVDKAVSASDEPAMRAALSTLLAKVRSGGTPVPDDALEDSDLILPSADSTLEDVKKLVSGSEEGLIPG